MKNLNKVTVAPRIYSSVVDNSDGLALSLHLVKEVMDINTFKLIDWICREK